MSVVHLQNIVRYTDCTVKNLICQSELNFFVSLFLAHSVYMLTYMFTPNLFTMSKKEVNTIYTIFTVMGFFQFLIENFKIYFTKICKQLKNHINETTIFFISLISGLNESDHHQMCFFLLYNSSFYTDFIWK